MIVSISGFNCTGSSAVIDLLKDSKELIVFDREIMFVYSPDGIMDLEYAIMNSGTYLCGDVAVHRFQNLCKHIQMPKNKRAKFIKIVNKYLDSLAIATWRGYSSYDLYREKGIAFFTGYIKKIISCSLFHFFKIHSKINYRRMVLSYSDDYFLEKTNVFLLEFEQLFSANGNNVVFNQFFSAYNPINSMKYSKNSKTIIVNRDPRDVYITEQKHKDTICFPTNTVENFVAYYKKCFVQNKTIDNPNILYINFEDLIYCYKETVQKIEEFLNINIDYNKCSAFNPNISINNTQLFLRFHEFDDEIKYIENELHDYLYDFPFKRIGDKEFF